MLLHGLRITGNVFNISIKDLAVLYEYWCFIKLNSLMKDRYKLINQNIKKIIKLKTLKYSGFSYPQQKLNLWITFANCG